MVSQGLQLVWADIKLNLKALQEVIREESGTMLSVSTECQRSYGVVPLAKLRTITCGGLHLPAIRLTSAVIARWLQTAKMDVK